MTEQAPLAETPLPAGQGGSPVARAALAVAGVVAVVAVSLAAILARPALVGDGATAQAAPPDGVAAVVATGHTTEVTLTVAGMSFTPSVIDVPLGDRLVVTVRNTADQRHDLVFANGAETPVLAPGAQATLDVGMIGANLEGWCSLPGHRQMGMVVHVVALGEAGAPTSPASPTDSMGGMGDMSGHSTGASPTMAELAQEAQTLPAYPAELAPLEPTSDHRYTFRVTEQPGPVTADLSREVWTYNGTAPGPVLHGRIGDTFHVTLINDGTMEHSIDFHAGEVAPDGPMRNIGPGESLEYTFTASRAGIWMYHCSTMPMSSHIANGMFGVVVIEPDELEPVDRSYIVVQSEMYLGADGQPADAEKIAGLVPDVVAFNGRAFQYDAHPLTAKVGERVRIWVLDAGPNLSLAFHVVGVQFDTVWSEGGYSVHRGISTDGLTRGATGAQVLPLLTAEGGFVEFVPREAGHYAFVNHAMSLSEKGAHGILEVGP